MALRINLTKTAWSKFLSCSPSPEDVESVKTELTRLTIDPGRGTPILFSVELKAENCKVIWAEATKKWYIVYREGNPDVDVLLIDEAV